MLRSLNLAYTFPYPPKDGYELRIWNLMRLLGKRIEQTLVCRSFEPVAREYLRRMNQENIRVRNTHIPRPGLFEKLAKGLSFLPRRYPVKAAGWYFGDIERVLEDLVMNGNFDIITIEGSWLGVYWPTIARSKAAKVLTLHNLEEEWLWRNSRILPLGARKLLFIHDALKMGYLENRLVGQVDLVFVTSERERIKLAKRHPSVPVVVAPNGVDCHAIRPLHLSRSREILFVGSMTNFPNVDGVLYFVKEVLPSLRQEFPDLVFRIVGKRPVKEIRELHKVHGIEVMGEVEDLEGSYCQCALCVVPIRSGGGTRLKILEAMAYGRPVVSTSIGCEGIDVENNRHILIADGPSEIFNAIRSLLSQPSLAASIVSNARSLVVDRYSWDKIADGILEQYEMLTTGRKRAKSDS